MESQEILFSMDGEVLGYDAVTSTQNIGGIKFNEDYHTDYFNADGEDTDEFYDAEGDGYDNFFGKKFRKAQAKRERRRALREQSKARARETKAKAQLEQAKAQQMSAKASEKAVASDVAIADALRTSATPTTPMPTPEETKKGLSMGAKIGIGVGVAVVLGVAGFFIWKSMKNKGK